MVGTLVRKVIVFGNNHHNTLGLCRSIGEFDNNTELYLILLEQEGKRCFCSKCRYINKSWIISNEEQLINILLNTKEVRGAIIITTGDSYARLIYKNYDRLKNNFVLGVGDTFIKDFESLQDKKYVSTIASNFGLSCPKELSIDFDKSISEQIESIGIPLFVKANSSAVGGKEFTKRFDDYESCIDFLEINRNSNVEIQIQEYIKKDLEISFLGVALSNGEIVVPGVIKKIREFPIGFGSSSFAVLDPDISQFIEEKKLKDFVKCLDYIGLFSIEFLVRNDELYFLEINLRNDGNGYVPTKGNVNLVGLYIMSFEKDIKQLSEKKTLSKKVFFMNEIGDLKYTISKRRNVFKWFKDIYKTDCFLLYNAKDLKPFFYKFYYQILK